MSTAKKLPKGLPALPPVPVGWDAWEYMGQGWTGPVSPSQWWAVYEHGKWTTYWHKDWSPSGFPRIHYIRAIKRPAAKKAKGKRVVAKRGSCIAMGECFVLPADAASVERMTEQVARGICASHTGDPDRYDLLGASGKVAYLDLAKHALAAIGLAGPKKGGRK